MKKEKKTMHFSSVLATTTYNASIFHWLLLVHSEETIEILFSFRKEKKYLIVGNEWECVCMLFMCARSACPLFFFFLNILLDVPLFLFVYT